MRVYPFKSLDGVDVEVAALTSAGSLVHDREFALVDTDGAFVNGKRAPRVHRLRATYDLAAKRATFVREPNGARLDFDFDGPCDELEEFLSEHFEQRIAVARDVSRGFPDDTSASGPTLVSRATLDAVAEWFPGLSAADVRERLRANLEIDGVPAFWEDRLFAGSGTSVGFSIGRASFEGINPCARCVVPSRDARTGAVTERFAKIVAERRAATLPVWADRSQFDHFYRLTINTRARPDSIVRVGDDLTFPSERRYSEST